MFVVVTTLGITLASNLAAGFIVGIVLAFLLRSQKLGKTTHKSAVKWCRWLDAAQTESTSSSMSS